MVSYNGMQLYPGDYLIELAFTRDVTPETLARALSAMGFTSLSFDQSLPAPSIGLSLPGGVVAVPSMVKSTAMVSAPAMAKATAALTTSKVSAPAVLEARPAPAASSPTSPGVQPSRIVPSPAPAAKVVMTAAPRMQQATETLQRAGLPTAQLEASRLAMLPKASAQPVGKLQERPGMPGGGGGGGGGEGPAASPAESNLSPATVSEREPLPPAVSDSGPEQHLTPQEDPGQGLTLANQDVEPPPSPGPGGGNPAFATNQVAQPEEEDAQYQEGVYDDTHDGYGNYDNQTQTTAEDDVFIEDEWADDRVWADTLEGNGEYAGDTQSLWDSPAGQGQEQQWDWHLSTQNAQFSGVGSTITVFRLIGRLAQPIQVCDLPDMTWSYIRRLVSDPFADMNYRLRPWRLTRGKMYEVRLFSRDKSMPTRQDVLTQLGRMGFCPEKLVALKKNIRLPSRNTSLTLWSGTGQWRKVNSVVVESDPFYFETLQEVAS